MGKAESSSEAPAAVLFTCIGRRVSLLNAFRQAAQDLGRDVRFYGTDVTDLSPALQLCDEGFLVDPVSHSRYLDQLFSIVRAKRIGLLVPTIDLDLLLLARHREAFGRLGCRVLISSPGVVEVCQDKRQTDRFLWQHGFAAPMTWGVADVLAADLKQHFTWPCFLKPWDGHAAKGAAVVHDRQELLCLGRRVPDAICQELIEGTEFTCDVYVDFEMQVRCVVPRQRLDVRSGEVSKARVAKRTDIMTEVARLVESLGAGPGVITVQLFETPSDELKFIEVNPRFGGGAPLSIAAGANFPKWLLQELAGKPPHIDCDAFQDGLTMLRYDAEVWVADASRACAGVRPVKA